MPDQARSSDSPSTSTSRKKTILLAGLCLLALVGGVFGYIEIFRKGIDRLPSRPCDGAVDRETAARALPPARSAKERGKLTIWGGDVGKDFTFYCYVRTSDLSTISGEAESVDASVAQWLATYRNDDHNGRPLTEVSVNDIRALVLTDTASVYVPCTPPGKSPEKARHTYALISEVRTIGKTRVEGAELQQVLLDFAFEMTEHAYKAGRCQEPLQFPDRAPRIKG